MKTFSDPFVERANIWQEKTWVEDENLSAISLEETRIRHFGPGVNSSHHLAFFFFFLILCPLQPFCRVSAVSNWIPVVVQRKRKKLFWRKSPAFYFLAFNEISLPGVLLALNSCVALENFSTLLLPFS